MDSEMIRDIWLNTNPDSRTYNTLCSLLPAVSELQLPSLKTVLTGIYDDGIFCSSEGVDGTLTVYRRGFYLYAEQDAATVYSVSLAGSLMNENYTSLTTDSALEAETLTDLPWFQCRLVKRTQLKKPKISLGYAGRCKKDFAD